MAENSNKGFNLDLSDIKATKQVVKDEVPPEAPKGPVEPTGYIVRSEKNENGEWIHTDLAELTSEQFVEWAKTVYPFHSELEASNFNTRSSKMRTVQSIVKFHEESFLCGKRQNAKSYTH